MDLQNISDLHCSICFELFGENLKCPRVLTCGHSFCHSCLENLLVQCLSCPICKQEILFPNVFCIPVNYVVKSLASESLPQKLLGNLTLPKQCCSNHLTIEVIKDWCHEKSVYALHCINGSDLYGKVDVKGDRVWIHCFVSPRPQSEYVVIPFTELLTTFNGSTELPKRGFIQVDDGLSGVSDIIIATDGLTPRAMNFLILCSGIKGRSYKGERLENIGRSIATSYFEGEGEAVVEGIGDEGIYEAPMKKGFVCGRWAKFADSLSMFIIWMKESEGKLDTKFGFVEEGIEVCERIFSNKMVVDIKRCGLVI